jgi:hypothetical protein
MPFTYGSRNLKSENSQDYAQKPQWIARSWIRLLLSLLSLLYNIQCSACTCLITLKGQCHENHLYIDVPAAALNFVLSKLRKDIRRSRLRWYRWQWDECHIFTKIYIDRGDTDASRKLCQKTRYTVPLKPQNKIRVYKRDFSPSSLLLILSFFFLNPKKTLLILRNYKGMEKKQNISRQLARAGGGGVNLSGGCSHIWPRNKNR